MSPRTAGEADIPLLAALHAAAFPAPERWGGTALSTMLGMPGAYAILADGEGFVLARAAAGEAEVLTLAVLPERRRRGAGSSLLAAAAAAAAQRGADAMFLEVSERNDAARALYAAAGFISVGRRRHYYADGADALVLRLPLRPGA